MGFLSEMVGGDGGADSGMPGAGMDNGVESAMIAEGAKADTPRQAEQSPSGFLSGFWNGSGLQKEVDAINDAFSSKHQFGQFLGEQFNESKRAGSRGDDSVKLAGYQEQQAEAPSEGNPMMYNAESELNRLKSRMGQQ